MMPVRRAPHRASLVILAILISACAADGPGATSLPSALPSVAASPVASATTEASPPAGLPGGWLMFSRFDESTHTFLSTHLIRPDGTEEAELVLPGPEGGGRWSHDSSRIAVMTILEDERIGTAVIQRDGTVDRVLEIPVGTLNLVCTVWSPDDTRLACEGFADDDPSLGGVYTVRASDGSDLQRLTTAPAGMNDIPGDYSPDGAQVIFKRTTGEADAPLMVVNVGGGEPQPLSDDAYEDPGRFSPDGETVLTSAGGQLVFVGLNGEVTSTITESGAFLFGAVWSPDGEWIAYSRDVSGFVADVFVSRTDGSEAWQVTHTSANEIDVEWGAEPG
jgi:Tol biopolymer transport system component